MPDARPAGPAERTPDGDHASQGRDFAKEEGSARAGGTRSGSAASGPEPGPDAGTADPTDGRQRYDWRSHYPDDARAQIRREAYYIVFVLFTSLILIVATWKGILAGLLAVTGDDAATLKKYSMYSASGLLGGAVFGTKYLYRVVARGYWHVDRKLWRYLSPMISFTLAFVMGAAVEASFVSSRAPTSTQAIVTFGFLVGYFADHTIGKLQEVATVMFGTSTKPKDRSKEA